MKDENVSCYFCIAFLALFCPDRLAMTLKIEEKVTSVTESYLRERLKLF